MFVSDFTLMSDWQYISDIGLPHSTPRNEEFRYVLHKDHQVKSHKDLIFNKNLQFAEWLTYYMMDSSYYIEN